MMRLVLHKKDLIEKVHKKGLALCKALPSQLQELRDAPFSSPTTGETSVNLNAASMVLAHIQYLLERSSSTSAHFMPMWRSLGENPY